MRVFDFDNTIYDGESVLDFYLFSLRKHPKGVKYFFVVLFNFAKYKFGMTTMDNLERTIRKYAEGYMCSLGDIPSIAVKFWDSHLHKVKPWYKPRPDDVILTASFNVIMEDVCRRLGVTKCICSLAEPQSAKVTYLNFSENKLKKFREVFGNDAVVDEFYTDNGYDKPMIEYAKSAFLVKGSKIKKIK